MTLHNPSGSSAGLDDALELLSQLLASEGVDVSALREIRAREPGAPVPMSFAQELLWMLDRAVPGMTAYNMVMSRRVRGPLDRAALETALSALVARHEALRSRFGEVDGELRQLVDAPAPVVVRRIDVSGQPQPEAAAAAAARERARTPFDLAHEHPFRVSLIRIADNDHVMLLESHHIAVDGWSQGVLFRELSALYAGARASRAPLLPAPTLQYGDYAVWQRTHLTGQRLESLLSFWRTQLGDAMDPLELSPDFRRPSSPTFAGARESIVLPADLLAGVKALAQGSSATLYMVLLAAYATVLHRYTGRRDVLIGSGSAGRAAPELEGLVGYVNNTLVQRADFAGDPTFVELLGRVRASALAAYDHQDVPLEKLVLELRRGDERLSTAPLFDVVLTMQDTLPSSLELEGLTVEPFGAEMGATKFDITLFAAERDGELGLTVQYRSDLFAPATMRRFLGHLRAVLEVALTQPAMPVSAIPLLGAGERSALAAWNATGTEEGPAATLPELFEAQVARIPQRAALIGARRSVPGERDDSTSTLSYAELDARANQLAHRLRTSGVGRGTPVGLLLDRSLDALVALWGILKAGGAYVPLSVDAPPARLAQQLTECGAKAVVTIAALEERAGAGAEVIALDRDAAALERFPSTRPEPLATPDSLAYVLYTSGSTGTPKGVGVTHANVVHYARAVSRVLADVPSGQSGDGFARLDGWQFALASTLAADLGNTALYPALLAGATLHVLRPEDTTEPTRFAEYVASHPLDVLKITPSHLMALAAGRTGDALRAVVPRQWLVLGGAALRTELAAELLRTKCRVLNHYGPTETTVGVLCHEVTADSLEAAQSLGAQTVPLGRPLANTHAYVVDASGRELPIGVPGELLVGGAGVTTGYVGRPDLTAERFIDFAGERVYRTGDRVRRLSNGTIEFLGRTDDQVKVRGYRVELREIELALRAHPGVADAAVLLEDEALVACVVPRSSGYGVSHADRPSSEKLVQWLEARLPAYMVPRAVVLVDALPLTSNGKIDRTRLATLARAGTEAPDTHVAPRNATETELAQIWCDVLKQEKVGVTDNFLSLGGHSLLAIRALGRIAKTFKVRLALRALFDAPTIEQLARLIEAERATSAAVAPDAGLVPRSREAYRIGRSPSPGSTPGSED